MGLGKTFTTIVAIKEIADKAVVVVPASLKTNWAREILMVDPEANIEIADGGKWYLYHDGTGSQWRIANYDVLSRDNVKEKIRELLPAPLIGDEAHYIKNSSTQRTKAFLELAEEASHVYLLTGTPILNRPMELFTLLKAIGHTLGKSWYGYAKKYCAAHKKEFMRVVRDRNGRIMYDDYGRPLKKRYSFLDTSGSSNLAELAEKIQDAYLRRTKEVLGDTLPAKVIDNIEVDIAPQYRKKYETVWDDYIAYLRNIPQGETEANIGNAELARHIIELNKLKQVASAGKIPYAIDTIKEIVEQDEKVIVFTQYTETLKNTVEELKKNKIKTVSLSGSDNSTARQKAVDAFQNDPKTKVIVANIKTGGVGITLTEASTVLFIDMEWTPALHSQAEDRAHRIGQQRQVNVHYFIAKGTVDEDIVELLEKKQQVIQKILEGDDTVSHKDITKKAIERMLKKSHAIHN